MNVDSVMSNYNLNSYWNSLNSNNSTSSNIFSISNIDENVKDSYTKKSISGESTSSELQDIYKQLEPTYGVNLTYDQNGNMSIPTTSAVTDPSTSNEQNLISLFNSSNSTDNSFNNILSQYNSIEDGINNLQISSILSSNPSSLYSYINSLGSNETQSSGNYVSATL
ncbi:hypothetical protein [Clostridium sp.]|uniref:hypothetical protein n=1 Tax=Clostridium sp. TaxID=1506 RepID=UPI0028455590|nr:hypothetical protein [Clostridium sp.]MDR3598789.1 hypothetical protein [Clostridium sp.]